MTASDPRTRTAEPDPAFAALFGEVAGRLPGDEAMAAVRRTSFARFAELGIPTNRVEEWKYTNVARQVNRSMVLARAVEPNVDQFARFLAGGPATRRLIFVNGELQQGISHTGGLPPGIVVRSLARMLDEEPERVREACSELDDGRSFTSLNTAFVRHGAWIELAPGVMLDQPVQLLFLTAGEPGAVMSHPRCIVRLGEGARLRLVETHAGMSDGANLTNLVLQLRLGRNAQLIHDRLQLPCPAASFIGKVDGDLADGSRYVQTVATMGGSLVRNETELRVVGSGVECLLNGAYLPCTEEHIDNFIRIHHRAPGSHSNQFYKGVIDGHSRAVFHGKIIVHQAAQKTNAFQANNNLLLSDDAELDTKPELEIYADDVKCSHGATCGDIDPLALFYIRSRGLDAPTARSMLTYAFAAEVFERFGEATVRAQAQRAALERLPGGAALREML